MISNGTIIRLFTINYGIIVFRAPPEFGILVTIPWIKLFLPRCYFLVFPYVLPSPPPPLRSGGQASPCI
jgi:hypothetical protein